MPGERFEVKLIGDNTHMYCDVCEHDFDESMHVKSACEICKL